MEQEVRFSGIRWWISHIRSVFGNIRNGLVHVFQETLTNINKVEPLPLRPGVRWS